MGAKVRIIERNRKTLRILPQLSPVVQKFFCEPSNQPAQNCRRDQHQPTVFTLAHQKQPNCESANSSAAVCDSAAEACSATHCASSSDKAIGALPERSS